MKTVLCYMRKQHTNVVIQRIDDRRQVNGMLNYPPPVIHRDIVFRFMRDVEERPKHAMKYRYEFLPGHVTLGAGSPTWVQYV